MSSLGTTSAAGIPDQYSNGAAAKVWKLYIGDQEDRTMNYKNFLIDLLKNNSVKHVLDAACGTGVDSIMLLEEGFRVTSSDASDKMLKVAYKTRWERRKETMFEDWTIEEANWLTLQEHITPPEDGFDALICMGNSFAHLHANNGDQTDQRRSIENFYSMLKPGGILVIDHRNYDYILKNGSAPSKNIYYNSSHIKDIKTSVLYVENKANMITLDYIMDLTEFPDLADCDKFRLSYYPHTLRDFSVLLRSIFGEDAEYKEFGDFRPIDVVSDPSFFIHVVYKAK